MKGKHVHWYVRGCAFAAFFGAMLLCITSSFGVVTIVQTVIS